MKPYIPTPDTSARWSERVRAWRASGQSAADFASGREFSASSLKWWGSHFASKQPQRFVRLVTSASHPPISEPAVPLLLEVGCARLHVTSATDTDLLVRIVAALGLGAT